MAQGVLRRRISRAVTRGMACLAVCVLMQACFKEEALKLPFTTYEPAVMADGWTVATPEAAGMDGAALTRVYRDFHERSDLWQVRSLLVFRHGRLVAESYTKDTADRTRPTAVWSCTKQVMALLTGMALERGLIADTADTVGRYLPEAAAAHPDKAAIRIRDLLTMRSGIGFENGGLYGGSNQLLKQMPDNSLDFVLGLPLRHAPGTAFHYSDGDPQILSAVLQAQTGQSVRDWAREVLFEPLGMHHYDWIVYRDGLTMGAFGISATPREMARFGQLVLDGGRWRGNPLVAADWVATMTSPKVSAYETAYHGLAFGYYWWVDEARGVVFMHGQGGQYVFVQPSAGLVVVMTAEPNTQGTHQFTVTTALDVLDAVAGSISKP